MRSDGKNAYMQCNYHYSNRGALHDNGSWQPASSNGFPPIQSVLTAKIWQGVEYQALRERLAKPIVAPTVNTNSSLEFITVDCHTYVRLYVTD